MRVLLIDVNCKTSSTGQIVYNLYSYLNSHGDEAAVCYGRGEKIKENNIFKFGLDLETYLHAFLTRLTGYTGCFSFFSTRRLIKYIKYFKPDIVHIHELHAYFVNIKPLLLFLEKNNIKVIHTLHCEFSYTGKCGHSVECEKWKTECNKCPHLKDYPATLFFDHTGKMQSDKRNGFSAINEITIVTPSEWLAKRANQSFFKNRQIKIIHNGIDTDIFKPVDSSLLKKDLGIKPDEKIVLSVAPNIMSHEKGGEYVLQIAQKLNDYNIRFVIVGSENPPGKSDNNLIIKGKIYEKKILAQYYSMADLFLICSERENYPTTCLEAQACGTPICGFDTGGTRETDFNKHSFWAKYPDVEDMAEKILKILETDSQLDQLKINVKKFQEEYSVDAMCKQYYTIYRSNKSEAVEEI